MSTGPGPVRYAVFSDFDETYLAHVPSERQRGDLEALEDFLVEEAHRVDMLFAWVTGSSLDSVLAKAARHHLRVLPHFVACSMGTELAYFDGGEPRPDEDWRRLMSESGYTRAVVSDVVAELARAGIVLRPQSDVRRGEFIDSYYYTPSDSVPGDGPETDGGPGDEHEARAVGSIRSACARAGIGVNVSRCNPKAGDPEGSFDVDLIPRTGGKAAVVAHLCARYRPARTFAFGDSGNDLDMLRSVQHGLLVANATRDARSAYPRVAQHAYAAAILHAITGEVNR